MSRGSNMICGCCLSPDDESQKVSTMLSLTFHSATRIKVFNSQLEAMTHVYHGYSSIVIHINFLPSTENE